MNKSIRIVCSFIALAAISFTAAADDGPAAAQKRFVTAFNAGDSAGVAAVFHEDGKLLPSGEQVVSGRKDIEAYWQAAFDAGLAGIEKTPIEMIVDSNLAVETNTYMVTFGENEIPGKETLVWRKDSDGKWMISTDIWNSDS